MSPAKGPAGATLPPPPSPTWEPRPAVAPEVVAPLVEELGLPGPLCELLAARGLEDPEAAKSFLRPLLDTVPGPERLRDALRASRRIAEAVRRGETILVHGDYDVDGIAGTALLVRGLRRLGGEAVPFVPHRVRDGYDFGPAGLQAAQEASARLVITVDSGVTAHGPLRRAREMGIDVVVTDHHTPEDTLPPAEAVVNPNRSDCPYPFKGLCGTAVAFKLLLLTARELGAEEASFLGHLDLVALATVADLVPLEGENRTLVRYGLRALAATETVGLRALIREAGLEGEEVDAGQVGFVLAPRINAAGRISEPSRALRLFLTDDPEEARELARHLEGENRLRREEEARTADEALEILARSYRPQEDFGVVVASGGWHPGVIGIVASRVVERLHRPTVLVATDGTRGRGSARSVPGFHLYRALKGCAEELERFGGHRQAAGLDIQVDRLESFQSAFNREAKEGFGGVLPTPRLRVEVELPLSQVSRDLHHYLQYVGPFGMGNPRPVFYRRGVEVAGAAREVGRGHLKLSLRENGVTLDAIGFGLAQRRPPEMLSSGPVDVAFQVRENEYRGISRLQARLLDIRPSREGGP